MSTNAPNAPNAPANNAPVELLYPELGNQGGDNGNAMYIEACLSAEQIVRTSHNDKPYFVDNDPAAIMIGGTTEAQQELIVSRLMSYRERLIELTDAGVPMLFSGNASELLGAKIIRSDGSSFEALGLFDFVTRRYMPKRFHDVQVGVFNPGNGADPFDVVGFKMQFTLTEGDNSDCYFIENRVGFGINKESKLEGFRRNNVIATEIIGPLLPLNPLLTRWFLDAMGKQDAALAFEEEAMAAYEKHAREMVYPGMHLHY